MRTQSVARCDMWTSCHGAQRILRRVEMGRGFCWLCKICQNPGLDGSFVTARCLLMKQVLIIGSSGGIGQALTSKLRAQGFNVATRSRTQDGFDITDEESVEAGLEGLQDLSGLIIASGALEIDGAIPEKSVRFVTQKAMMDQFAVNAVGPALVLKHAARLLCRDARAVCAVLTARVGSIGDNKMGGWISYRAAKAAANQIVRTTSIELARSHPRAVCVAIHPGTVDTSFTQKYVDRHPTVTPDTAASNILAVLNGLGPSQSGGFYDWAGKPMQW